MTQVGFILAWNFKYSFKSEIYEIYTKILELILSNLKYRTIHVFLEAQLKKIDN